MGETGFTNDHGFEEWAFSEDGGIPGGGDLEPPPDVIPEPSSIVLLGMGAFCLSNHNKHTKLSSRGGYHAVAAPFI